LFILLNLIKKIILLANLTLNPANNQFKKAKWLTKTANHFAYSFVEAYQ
jgi:hypothetical protein